MNCMGFSLVEEIFNILLGKVVAAYLSARIKFFPCIFSLNIEGGERCRHLLGKHLIKSPLPANDERALH